MFMLAYASANCKISSKLTTYSMAKIDSAYTLVLRSNLLLALAYYSLAMSISGADVGCFFKILNSVCDNIAPS